jgi:D-glycero-D-manno-heptose 1,7-bisphosphate phosphatase
MTPRRCALFLDRDGVVNHDPGYLHRRQDFVFIDGIFELARIATDKGLALVIVTNQTGIGRGFFTEADFHALMDWVAGEFAARGTPIARIEFCPDHPTAGLGAYRRDSDRRKPGPGMILDAAETLGIDLAGSIMVGDRASDVLAGQRAGVGTNILVTTDLGEVAAAPLGIVVLPSVTAVATWLAS